MPFPLPARPNRDPSSPSRTIDQFYDAAHTSGSSTSRVGYWILLLALGVANSGDATEIGSMNYILSHDLFREEILGGGGQGVDYGGRGAAIASSIFAGMLIGGVVTGAYGDRLGRRPTLLAGLFLNSLSGIASALSPNAVFMCLCRFFAGVGIGAVLSSLIALATELSPPVQRGWYITAVGSFWTLGSVFVAVMAWVLFGLKDYSWRVFALVSASPCLLGGIMVWALVPESPRYLALQGRYNEAARVANDVANGMGYRGPPLEVDEVEKQFAHMVEPKPLSSSASSSHTRDALRRIGNLFQEDLRYTATIPLMVIWFSMSFGSGLCTWITKIFEEMGIADVYLQSLYFALANIPGNIAASYLVERIGRKLLLVLSMLASSLSLLVSAHGARDTEARQLEVILASCAFHAFLVMGWSALSCMTSELFPTAIRSTGMGVCSGVGRVAGILVQFVNGALISRPTVLLLAASGCIMFGALAPIVLKVVDMTDKHLNDISAVAMGVIEGDGQAIHTFPLGDMPPDNSMAPDDIDPDGTELVDQKKAEVV